MLQVHCVPWEQSVWMVQHTAEIIEEKRRTSDSACMLLCAIHSKLILWYTTGFE